MIKKIILITIITFITFGVIACSSNSGEALIDTARNGDLETAKLLIENGTDINANDKDGVTDLMQASENGNLETVKDLVERKRVNMFRCSTSESSLLSRWKILFSSNNSD